MENKKANRADRLRNDVDMIHACSPGISWQLRLIRVWQQKAEVASVYTSLEKDDGDDEEEDE